MNCTENNQNGTGQITDDHFHHDCRAYCAVCMPPLPPPIEALAHCLSAGGGRSWPLDRCPPIPWLPTFENKQTFLSTSLVSLLAFELWAPGTTVNNRVWHQQEAAFLVVSCSGGFPKWSHRHDDTWEAREKPIAPGFLAAGVDLRAIPSSCQSFVSGFLPVSPLLSPGGQGSLSLVEWKDASGRETVSPPVCIRLTSLLSTKCAVWAFLPVGSDVCLRLRLICVDKCLSGIPYGSSSGGFVIVLSSGV